MQLVEHCKTPFTINILRTSIMIFHEVLWSIMKLCWRCTTIPWHGADLPPLYPTIPGFFLSQLSQFRPTKFNRASIWNRMPHATMMCFYMFLGKHLVCSFTPPRSTMNRSMTSLATTVPASLDWGTLVGLGELQPMDKQFSGQHACLLNKGLAHGDLSWNSRYGAS